MATIETIGPSGCDFSSPQAWWDANKEGADGEYVGEIESAEYPGLTATGSTGTKTWTLRATSGYEFKGIFDGLSNFPRIAGIAILNETFTLVGVVSIDFLDDITGLSPSWHYGIYAASETGSIVLERCGFNGSGDISVLGHTCVGILLSGAVARVCVISNLTKYSDDDAFAYGMYIIPNGTHLTGAYHCTISSIIASSEPEYGYDTVAYAYGLVVNNTNIANDDFVSVVRNCVIVNTNATGDNGTYADIFLGQPGAGDSLVGDNDIDYNAYESYAGGDLPAIHDQLITDTDGLFAGNNDFHLGTSAEELRGNAGSLVGYDEAPTEDIDGGAISNDIGCDSYNSLTVVEETVTHLAPFSVGNSVHTVGVTGGTAPFTYIIVSQTLN